MKPPEILKDTNTDSQLSYFKIFAQIPLILALSTMFLTFIWGIIDPCIFNFHSSFETSFGVLRLPNGFLCWSVWMSIGCVLGGLEFVIGKIILSPTILKVLYLQKISETTYTQDNLAVKPKKIEAQKTEANKNIVENKRNNELVDEFLKDLKAKNSLNKK